LRSRNINDIVLAMNKYKLSEYLALPGNTQTALAKSVGITQGAVSQMLIKRRPVYVIVRDDGTVELEQVRKIGRVAV
jgi:predicted transcriptional regulator